MAATDDKVPKIGLIGLPELPDYRFAGFEIIETLKLPSGIIYPLLKRIEDRNWATASWVRPSYHDKPLTPTLPRAVLRYSLTNPGREAGLWYLGKHATFIAEIAPSIVFRDHTQNTRRIEYLEKYYSA